MAKLIDLMRQAGVQWPEGAEYAAQDEATRGVFFYTTTPKLDVDSGEWRSWSIQSYFAILGELAEDWESVQSREECGGYTGGSTPAPSHLDPDYMREQQRIAARRQERHGMVRELMLRHPELTGQQAIAQADEIIDTLEGLRDGA